MAPSSLELQPDSSGRGPPAGPAPFLWGDKTTVGASLGEAAVAAQKPVEISAILFGKLAEMWRTDFVEREVGGRALIAASTQAKYVNHLENHILPRWKDTRIAEFRAKDILDWLQTEYESWYTMADLRNIMSGIFSKAQGRSCPTRLPIRCDV